MHYYYILAEPITLTMIFWYIFTAAIMAAVSYYGGKLLMDEPREHEDLSVDPQSRSWNPRSTQRVGIARPRTYGRNMHHGNIVAKWTDVSGNDREILYMVIEHGDGPTKGIIDGELWFDDQPAENFSGVTVQERVGTMGQTCMTGFEKTKLEYTLNNELENGEPITFTTPNDFFDEIEFTLLWPNGLFKYQKDGDRKASSTPYRVRISEHGADSWTVLFDSSYGGHTYVPLFKLFRVKADYGYDVERGKQYDLEFMRTGALAERHNHNLYIKSIREVVDIPFTRPGKALVGITSLATEQLSGNIDVKLIREDKLVNVFDGTSWSIKYSRNRAWCVFNVFTQPVITGEGTEGDPWVIEYYEGLSPEYMDIEFFYEWAVFCAGQVPDGYGGYEDRCACDTIIDFQTNVWELANEIAQVGRAHLYWHGSTLTGWIDAVVSPADITDLVTMDNIMARSWKNAWVDTSELAGKVEVMYADKRRGYERTPCPVPNEGGGHYTRIVTIEGVGITTRGTAVHTAHYALERNRLIRNTNNFRKHKDAFGYKLGKVVRVQHKTPDWGQAFRVVKKVSSNKVKLDRHCTAAAGELLWLRTYDSVNKRVRTDSYTVVSVSNNILTIAETWLSPPRKNDSCATGGTSDIQTRRVIKLEMRVDNYVEVTVETYDAELYDADNLVPDNPDQNYIWNRPANPLTQPVTRWDVIELINQLSPPQLDTDIPSISNCTWTGSGGDTVTWSKTDSDEPIIFRYKGTSYEITPDSTTDEFIYWDPAFNTTFRHTGTAAAALDTGHWMVCTNEAGVAHSATPMQLVHAAILQAGTITAAYGQIANLAVSTLKIQDNAVTLPVSAYTAAGWVTGDVQSVSITTTGAPLIIIGSVRVKATGTAEVLHRPYYVKLKRDTTEIYTSGVLYVFCWGTDTTGYTLTTIVYRETPSAGTYTYKLNVPGTWVTCAQRFLFVMETKK